MAKEDSLPNPFLPGSPQFKEYEDWVANGGPKRIYDREVNVALLELWEARKPSFLYKELVFKPKGTDPGRVGIKTGRKVLELDDFFNSTWLYS